MGLNKTGLKQIVALEKNGAHEEQNGAQQKNGAHQKKKRGSHKGLKQIGLNLGWGRVLEVLGGVDPRDW